MFKKFKKQPRLHSNLLFSLLFNVPQNEIMMHSLLKKRKQDANSKNQSFDESDKIEYNYSKLSVWEQ